MDDNTTVLTRGCDPNNYGFSGKVMLISVVILFVVCFIIVCFHSYARWSLSRRARLLRRHHHRSLRRAHNLAFHSESATNTPHGLDSVVLTYLPTVIYDSASHDPPLECAVCLSEFEDDETARLLPKCNHCFHVDCIDMWFHSHSNCPLCRAPVQPPVSVLTTRTTIQTVAEPPGSEAESSRSPASRTNEDQTTFCSSSSPPGLEVITVEVPVHNEGLRNPEATDAGSNSDNGFGKPGSPDRSLKRFWSI